MKKESCEEMMSSGKCLHRRMWLVVVLLLGMVLQGIESFHGRPLRQLYKIRQQPSNLYAGKGKEKSMETSDERTSSKAAAAHLKGKVYDENLIASQKPASVDPQYLAWEEEERQLQKEELLQKAQEMRDEEGLEGLPTYMLEILDEYGLQNQDSNPIPQGKLPTLAIIGRPNTGKSTLVNKITNSYKDGAIVHDEPGITRDRTYRLGNWCGYNFQVIDTGGIIFDDKEDIFAEQITQQALIALKEADAAILVCDGQQGVTTLDGIIADWLRKNNKVPVFIAVNKCESTTRGMIQSQDFWELGLGEPYPVSGIHGNGVGELLDIITTQHMKKVVNVLKENSTNVALVGRPNVGKSSLLNKIYGKERSIVSDVAGTTRDTVDVLIQRGNNSFRIIDTAGVRKRGKVEYGAEFFMVNRAFKAIRRSEVVVLVLDAINGIVDQDRILAERISEEGKACVIALNKWDAIEKKDDKSFNDAVDNIRSNLPVLRWADVSKQIFLSSVLLLFANLFLQSLGLFDRWRWYLP